MTADLDRVPGWIEVDGCVLEYVWVGPKALEQSTTLVFLHEGLGCTSLWRDFPERVSEGTGLSALVYSRAGYGGSGPARLPREVEYMHHEALVVLPAILSALEIGPAVLIGHSDGASISIIYSGSDQQERVRGLVLIAPHVFTEKISLEGIAAVRSQYWTTDLRRKLARHHGEKVDDTFQGWNDVWLNSEFRDWNIESFLPAVDVPMLLIQGTHDEYGSLAQLDAIEAGVLPTVERLVLEGVGHSPHREQSASVVDAICRFVSQLSSTP